MADIEAFVEGEGQRLNTSFTSIKRCVAGGKSELPAWVRHVARAALHLPQTIGDAWRSNACVCGSAGRIGDHVQLSP